ncbi:MAG: hypothetical protein A3C08_03055 [Candidatus Taylorbacteria bacterium RIFCSPHIGHO2_02_FULL_47_18]|nr:MAG: hypothetical protein A2670_02090 [Candidatus Taylorbacteria bacterium RIFCSPHIGHO2_01_FULL_48_38]OHA27712.1 MAG: hypothetical protein A3C08_03055 [Candidatus Taylorbacteria bacterium RIFCSPHIGHO2_02_FULL_47_18]OHA41044.1 MAG: hypothetical protein A3J31_03070 [Candidatus Taylorbacteria bacterium RIFCSPLOWO2_02_FULL_48_16]OHA45278.1 MAG: hypothetical protein A3H13_00130 [Candidatus Taylorbacteria bacterium RIFCSPLOWO2_12_FULL_48_11]
MERRLKIKTKKKGLMKENGNLELCLLTTIHHVDTHKIGLMMAGGATVEDFRYRFNLVRENVEAAFAHVKKIRVAAEAGKNEEVLRLLNDQTLEFGHNR